MAHVEKHGIKLARELNRVSSRPVELDDEQELRFDKLMDDIVMVDIHQHPMIMPDDISDLTPYLRNGDYGWCYEAIKYGGWTAVATANVFRGLINTSELSFVSYEDVSGEVAMMLTDVSRRPDIVKVLNSSQILSAKQSGKLAFFPTLEHLAIGNRIERIDSFYALGVRLAGITYTKKNFIGDGQNERNDGGLSEFGIEAVRRMNHLGMAIDVSHASPKTVDDVLDFSEAPLTFSHNASYTLRPTARTRKDHELLACAKKGGLIGITAVPNSLSDDPYQDISCVLDHYDYMVKLVGIDNVAIGTDTMTGDHVDFHRQILGRNGPGQLPAPYLDGLESPADGKNIIRGLIKRGYADPEITKIAGGNALRFFDRVLC